MMVLISDCSNYIADYAGITFTTNSNTWCGSIDKSEPHYMNLYRDAGPTAQEATQYILGGFIGFYFCCLR